MAQHNKPLDIVCKQLRNTFPLCVGIFITRKNNKLVPVFLVCRDKLAKYIRVVVHIKVRNYNADNLGFSVGENLCELVLLVIQRFKRFRYLALIFKREGVGIVEITGYCCFG